MSLIQLGFDAVYWLKFVAGLAFGFFSAFIVATLRAPLYTYLLIFAAAGVYILVAEIMWRTLDKHLRRRQSYLNGLGGYIGIFLLSWILFFNFLTTLLA